MGQSGTRESGTAPGRRWVCVWGSGEVFWARNSKCKGPGAGGTLACWRTQSQASGAGGWGTRGRVVGDEGRAVRRDRNSWVPQATGRWWDFILSRVVGSEGYSDKQWRCLVFMRHRLLKAARPSLAVSGLLLVNSDGRCTGGCGGVGGESSVENSVTSIDHRYPVWSFLKKNMEKQVRKNIRRNPKRTQPRPAQSASPSWRQRGEEVRGAL